MSLPVDDMVRVAGHMLERAGTGHPVHAAPAGGLACHVLAPAEEVERPRASPPRPRTIVHTTGGRWDPFESDRDAAPFVAGRRAEGVAAQARNVSHRARHSHEGGPAMNGTADPPDLHDARARSVGCPYCGGAGLVTLYDARYAGDPAGRRAVRRHDGTVTREWVTMRCATYCLCPAGDWLRARSQPDVRDRAPDLADVLEGRTRWTTRDPTNPPHPTED